MPRWTATLAAVAGLLLASSARAEETGTIVVQLRAEPAPAGLSWSYTGPGTTFAVGLGVTKHSIGSLGAGTYTIVETSPGSGRPPTLTGVTCSDPSGGSKGTIARAAASIRLAAGETVTCVFTHRAFGPKPTAAAISLAQQFAPTLRFSAAEHYRPLAVQDYLAQAALKNGKPPRGVTMQSRPTAFTLPSTPAPTYLDVRNAQPNLHASQYRLLEQRLEAARRPTVYWRLAREPSTGRLAIEYWFFYLYNEFADRHEADWEGVTVFVKNGAAIGVTFSQHQGRTWIAWPVAALDDHPVVYVAAGSHANYPLPGRYRVKVCYTIGVRRCTTTTQRDNAPGDGTALTSDSYDLHELGGVGYTGGWGSGTYLLGIGLTKDRVVDPRRRSDYSNPFASIPPGA
jgi:hypothetical protein